MKQLAIEILNKETEYENRIKALELERDLFKDKVKEAVEDALRLRLYDNGKYCSVSDFCRLSRSLLFIKETELKQWLLQQGVLARDNEKYVPNKDNNTCVFVENEMYIKYEFVRKNVLFLRTLIYVGDDAEVRDFVDEFSDNKEILVEQMANTVYVAYKQNSNEFRHHKENRFFIENEELPKIN